MSAFEEQPQQPDLFDNTIVYTEASMGSRFLNFLIDNLFMTFALNYATGYAIGYLLAFVAPDFLQRIADEGEKSFDYFLLAYIIGAVNYLLYYTISEKAFKGYTLGKLITGTRAIRNDGEPLTLKDAFLRTICRLVPFEVLSALGTRPWHDSWTKTSVVKAR